MQITHESKINTDTEKKAEASQSFDCLSIQSPIIPSVQYLIIFEITPVIPVPTVIVMIYLNGKKLAKPYPLLNNIALNKPIKIKQNIFIRKAIRPSKNNVLPTRQAAEIQIPIIEKMI